MSSALSACSPSNTPEAAKVAIAAGIANKEAADQVSAKVASVAAATRTTRVASSCGDFAAAVASVAALVAASPLASSLNTTLLVLVDVEVSVCTDNEKSDLAAAETTFTASVATIVIAVSDKNDLLELSTGESVDLTFAEETTTSASTTTVKATATTGSEQ